MPNRDRSLRKYREGYARAVFDQASTPTADSREQEIHIRAIHFRQQCIAKLALKQGETVIDAGCGTGLSFAALENGVGAGGSIIGIDQSLEQLAQARALVARSGWQNISLLNSPVEDAQIPVTADAALFCLTYDIMRTPRGAKYCQQLKEWGTHCSSGEEVGAVVEAADQLENLAGGTEICHHLRRIPEALEPFGRTSFITRN
jgi:SAM-dependent methyltransferase